MKQISSRDNPLFKSLKKLAVSPRERRNTRKCILDGVHLIAAYIGRIGLPERLVVSASSLDVREIYDLLKMAPASSWLILADALFDEIATVETPTGIMAVIDLPTLCDPEELSFVALVEAVQDPGNLGSILRSAAAAGVDLVYLSPSCADVWSPKVLRGAMGAHFVLPVREGCDLVSIAANFRGDVLATSLQADKSLFETSLDGPLAFVIGNEGAGVSGDLLNQATHQIKIPMAGDMESLNVATAAGICFFERVRQQAARH
ncbi:MAG: RNA methyltransferase [Sulfuricellaceae bacterium]|nr:RNA methyltransferase [Sulfuricellaceae bacterium]